MPSADVNVHQTRSSGKRACCQKSIWGAGGAARETLDQRNSPTRLYKSTLELDYIATSIDWNQNAEKPSPRLSDERAPHIHLNGLISIGWWLKRCSFVSLVTYSLFHLCKLHYLFEIPISKLAYYHSLLQYWAHFIHNLRLGGGCARFNVFPASYLA